MRTHGAKGWQVLVLRAQAVAEPRPHARPYLPGVATVEQQKRRLVVRHVGMHRTDDGDVVDRLGRVVKQLAYLDATLTVVAELERGGHHRPGGALGAEVASGNGLPCHLVKQRLVVERVDMRRATIHEEVNYPFRLGGKMG